MTDPSDSAARVIDAFSLPSDMVVVSDSSAVTCAAADAASSILSLAPDWSPDRSPDRRRLAFPAALPPPGDPAAGTAGLAAVGCHRPGCCGQKPGGETVQDKLIDVVFSPAEPEPELSPGAARAVLSMLLHARQTAQAGEGTEGGRT